MSRNRLANTMNPYQGSAKRVLCVCSAGILRSPTAANVLHKEFGYNTRSCGTDPEIALILIDKYLIHWAGEIVCMTRGQKEKILKMAPEHKVICLDIEDDYAYMDRELVELIKKRYNERKAG